MTLYIHVKCFNCLLSGLVGVATVQINSLFKVRHFKENRVEIRPIFFADHSAA